MCLCVHPEYCMGHNYIYTHMICIYIFHYKFHIMHIWRGTQHSGIIFWRWDTSVSVYQWSCCERLDSASVIFFWRLFQCVCPFYDGWFTSTSAHWVLSAQQFLTKNRMTPSMPCPPYSLNLALSDLLFCLFSQMKKVLKGIHFANVEKVKQQNGRSTKSHQNWLVQKLI